MKIHESGQDYLEAILILSQKDAPVRSIDVAKQLGVTKPSVSRAVSLLKNGKFVNMADDGTLTLTENGLKIAESMYERHRFFTDLLTSLGVNEETAAIDACRIEHVVSEESFTKLREHFQK
ncbi:MAG: metal-dependent transcriptional regulator [Clostridia bacterium]|nr:metal-dependent transcriptional regulator [Clostridia bacterium]MBQ4243276.1 metal-dependent transcriptional regulator [Clostridia bacterium]